LTAASLKGRFLVALPVLTDDNFDRTVVYMVEHTDEVAIGVVLNRPSPLELGELLPKWSELAAEPGVVFIGGPVGGNVAMGLGEASGHDAVVAVDLDRDPGAHDEELARVRVFVGYAGWSGGQLEDEIDAGAWVVVDGTNDDFLTDAPDRLWADVLRRQEGRLAAVASFPPDPTLN
jgi:putative transcriptional regulator